MKDPKESNLVDEILLLIDGVGDVIKNAKKHRYFLGGDHHYGNKFAEFQLNLRLKTKELKERVESIGNRGLKKAIDSIESDFDSLLDPKTVKENYQDAKKRIRLVLISEVKDFVRGGEVVKIPKTDVLVPKAIVTGTTDYIETVANQINGCYEMGWFDACAVMIRRLIETLIIECFEYKKISNKIKDNDGNYYYLSQLINAFLIEPNWQPKITRNTKKNLPKLKDIGDLSAHSRFYTAKKPDIERVRDWVRLVVQELIHIANLK